MTGYFEDNHSTLSLCPICLERITARRKVRGKDVYLKKRCPAHGDFQALIWTGAPEISAWHRPKIPTQPEIGGHVSEKGCPFDCGLCPSHRQKSCSVILEVTQRCNLGCRFCFADAGGDSTDPSLDVVAEWYQKAKQYGGACNLQLSGGEPTLRDDLPELVAIGRETGFAFIQINTNGLRLAAEPEFALALKKAGAASIFLQFDGTDDAVYRALRGRALLTQKEAAIANCAAAGLGVVLVPTLVPGVNTHMVGEILEAAMQWYPTVRGVHFQPVSFFGRHPGEPCDHQRLTLPELMHLIEAQTQSIFKADHFRPPGCEHSLCSFSAQYLIDANGRPKPLNADPAAWRQEAPIRAEEGAGRAIASVARQWSGAVQPSACGCGSTLQWDASRPLSLDDFLAMAQSRAFSVSAMAFQDVWNLDLERVRQCCIHVMAADGRLIPFCLFHLTAQDGQRLYC